MDTVWLYMAKIMYGIYENEREREKGDFWSPL